MIKELNLILDIVGIIIGAIMYHNGMKFGFIIVIIFSITLFWSVRRIQSMRLMDKGVTL